MNLHPEHDAMIAEAEEFENNGSKDVRVFARNTARYLRALAASADSALAAPAGEPHRTEPNLPWRVGRKVGRTLYANDQLIGVMDTPGLAALVVQAVNWPPLPVAAPVGEPADERDAARYRFLRNDPRASGVYSLSIDAEDEALIDEALSTLTSER